MDRALGYVDRLFMAGIAAAMALVVVVTSADVFGRYLLGHSLVFAGELSRLGFVWMSFLMMPLGVSRGLHVAITSPTDALPEVARRLVFRIGTALTILLMGVVFMGAWISIGARSYESLNTLPLTAAAFFWPLAIGSAWSIVHLTAQLLRGTPPLRDLSEQLESLP